MNCSVQTAGRLTWLCLTRFDSIWFGLVWFGSVYQHCTWTMQWPIHLFNTSIQYLHLFNTYIYSIPTSIQYHHIPYSMYRIMSFTALSPDTTVLSPYLKFGSLSIRKMFWEIKDIYTRKPRHSLPPVSLEGKIFYKIFYTHHCVAYVAMCLVPVNHFWNFLRHFLILI